MSPVVFPVTFEQLDAVIDFRELSEGDECDGSGYRVRAIRVRHPGGALGYRFTERNGDGGALVYISDNELNPSAPYDGIDPEWRDRLVEFTRGARVLVHDATYTKDEYDQHRGWGHSTVDDAVMLALDGEVGTLVLFHHEPERKDEDVDRCVDEARALVRSRGGTVEVIAAAEGLTLTI
jgi:ribonuclease BN (tRNA processing enzyme)